MTFFAIPGDLATPTGGYAYDRRVMELLPNRGIAVRHLALPGSFPRPSVADLERTAETFAGTPADAAILVDGLAYGAIPAALLRTHRRRYVALVHHPLAFETGLGDADRQAFLASERAALAEAEQVIATSAATARQLAAEFGVAAEKLSVAEPGTDPAPRARGTGDPPQLLAVGAVSPRKGYDVLVAALAMIAGRSWNAAIAGSLDRASATADALRTQIAAAGLADRITLAGAVSDDELAQLYDRADIFVLSSRYEGYGMVLGEAMAHGLAIVTTTGGAAAETVPDGAGLKVPPGDAAALGDALDRVIADAAERRRLADASWRCGQTLPRWTDTAARIAAVLTRVAGRESVT